MRFLRFLASGLVWVGLLIGAIVMGPFTIAVWVLLFLGRANWRANRRVKVIK